MQVRICLGFCICLTDRSKRICTRIWSGLRIIEDSDQKTCCKIINFLKIHFYLSSSYIKFLAHIDALVVVVTVSNVPNLVESDT